MKFRSTVFHHSQSGVCKSRKMNKLLAILLILQVVVAYSVPAGAHLNLCIGFDGHVDITLDDCVADLGHPNPPQADASHDDDHHGDCMDIAMGCASINTVRVSIREVCTSSELTRINKNITVNGGLSVLNANPLSPCLNQTSFYSEDCSRPSLQIDCLRSTVLLI